MDMTGLNLPIIIVVVIAGIVGFIMFIAFGDGKTKHSNSLAEIDDYDERRSAGVAGTHDKFYNN